jgi:hypothetical protein
VEHVKLQLAIAETCNSDGCLVKMLSDGSSLKAPYFARMKGRVIVHPGQLVALNMDMAIPEVTWRWHRLTVTEVRPDVVFLDDRGVRQVKATVAPGLTFDLQPGQTVFTNGIQSGDCEIHGLLVGDTLDQLEQVEELILPRIEAILASMPAA